MRFSRILFITAAMAATGVAAAQPGWHEHGASELTRGVALTEAQQDQVDAIEQTAWTQARPAAQQMRSLREQITARLLGSGEVTQTDLAPLMQQIAQLREQLAQTRISAALQIRAVMTSPQLAQAAAKHQQLDDLHQQEHRILSETADQ